MGKQIKLNYYKKSQKYIKKLLTNSNNYKDTNSTVDPLADLLVDLHLCQIQMIITIEQI